MIHPKCFSLQWIQEKREEFGTVDPGILEKSIHALALLSHLSASGLKFVFKGGTSLLLHLSPIRRLSIDIDIVCNEPSEKIRSVLESIAQKPPFVRFEEDERGVRGLPRRRHFRFVYNKIKGGHPSPFILLDIVEDNCLLPIISKPIITDFIEIDNETRTNLPTIEGLLGDKLTAFAPSTIGVPYTTHNGSQAMQVAKQMFDIGELFNKADDISQISSAYTLSFEKENSYRMGKFIQEDVLDDTILTCDKLCHWGLKGHTNNENTNNLIDGIKRLTGHLINSNFSPNNEAKIAAAKAALVANLIKSGNNNISLKLLRFSNDKVNDLPNINLEGEHAYLQKLKTVCTEAFYYYHQIEKLCSSTNTKVDLQRKMLYK